MEYRNNMGGRPYTPSAHHCTLSLTPSIVSRSHPLVVSSPFSFSFPYLSFPSPLTLFSPHLSLFMLSFPLYILFLQLFRPPSSIYIFAFASSFLNPSCLSFPFHLFIFQPSHLFPYPTSLFPSSPPVLSSHPLPSSQPFLHPILFHPSRHQYPIPLLYLCTSISHTSSLPVSIQALFLFLQHSHHFPVPPFFS